MLELFTSAKPVSLYIVCHGRLGVLINPQPLHHLSFAPTYNGKTHFQTCLSMPGMGRTLATQTALDKTCEMHSVIHLCKKAHTRSLTWNVLSALRGRFPTPNFITPVTENLRGFGSYLFIYSKPSRLSLSTQELVTLAQHSSYDLTLEGGMIKGSLARLGKTFPLRMDILPVKRLFPPRWGRRSHYSRVTTWKSRIWPQSPTYMFFFPTRANGRHWPEQNILLITCGTVGVRRVPLPNQYGPWATATV